MVLTLNLLALCSCELHFVRFSLSFYTIKLQISYRYCSFFPSNRIYSFAYRMNVSAFSKCSSEWLVNFKNVLKQNSSEKQLSNGESFGPINYFDIFKVSIVRMDYDDPSKFLVISNFESHNSNYHSNETDHSVVVWMSHTCDMENSIAIQIKQIQVIRRVQLQK